MNKEERIERLKKMLGPKKTPITMFSVPGRINLIGEHTDYNNCPVFPMAVDRDVLAACVPRKDQMIVVKDVQPDFGEIEFPIDKSIPPFPTGNWGNYIKAGVQEIINSPEHLSAELEHIVGFDMVIDSNIPPAAGMSSSSALVVLASLVFLWVNGEEILTVDQRLSLADTCARAERYTGTQGGGMDQAAILLGQKGHAMKIEFNPLRCIIAPLPETHIIVVAHSTVLAPKTQSAMDAYNRRSIECSLAAALISSQARHSWGIEGITAIGDLTQEKTGLRKEKILQLAEDGVRAAPYRLKDLARALGLTENEVLAKWCLRRDGSPFPEPAEGFLIHKRLTHVLTEWERVEKSVDALSRGDVGRFGELMNESHESCRNNHEISCKELDLLTDISRKAGAVGSRLTGAGFGGCTVNLVERSNLDRYCREVGELFYERQMNLTSWDEYLFPVEASDGAGEF